ncbi:preprotein translocase subunit YajC [Pacificimonas flava]|uniref:Sec translocon accessory complex subunit YajC n=2 Tax=Pacificimonas TaxID=1960290 RepID=A0A219B6T6_9SPHN|nr:MULTISPECIES: preprotein translocase subunit YajC [Pacificimonas]MBZ6378654.1 preprotein translocase subunit YajC [Pacificimonas aurantium]OWV34075.1 preprotein translocase subunit YajC [Pacificimonas flava]
MFSFPAYAQAGAPGGAGGILSAIMPLLLIIPIFYFLLIRPQQKRMKAHRDMIEAVQRNDTVVTAGGLVGKVKKVTETEVEVEIAAGTTVQVVKGTLSEVRPRAKAAAAND